MAERKYRVVAVLGLDCGLGVYGLLQEMDSVDLLAICARPATEANNIAGYIDLSLHVAPSLYRPYRDIDDINAVIDEFDDIDLVVAIGISDILEGAVLSCPRLGCLGAHAAPLPERPGSAPLIWAILDKLSETAMTIFRMSERIDDGPIYDREPVSIDLEETGGSLRTKMDAALLTLLRRCLPDILSGANHGKIHEGERHYTRRRGPRDGEFNAMEPADDILRKVRALSTPYPGAHFFAGDGVPIIVEQARRGDESLFYERLSVPFGGQSGRKVLCVVAHPDDEALGLTGTLIKHSKAGDRTSVIILSEGESAKQHVAQNDMRLDAARAFAKLTGINLHRLYELPDQALDTVPLIEIIQRLEVDIQALAPTLVYMHHPGDMNSDHQICAQAVLAALRPVSTKISYPEILSFETPSSTEQAPNVAPYVYQPTHYVRVDDVWSEKLKALQAYRDELQPSPHPRSLEGLEALARKRGAEIGVEKAEAFMLIRRLWT